MLVDDSKTARRLARMIVGASYDVIEAEDGTEALVKARAESPDLIVTTRSDLDTVEGGYGLRRAAERALAGNAPNLAAS